LAGLADKHGSGITGTVASGSSAGLKVAFLDTSFPESIRYLDLRPESWPTEFAGLCAAARWLINWMCCAFLWWACLTYWQGGFEHLSLASVGAGKSLGSTTPLGAGLSLSARMVIADAVTVGLATLPTTLMASLDSFNVYSVAFGAGGPIGGGAGAATTAAPGLSASMAAWGNWLSYVAPWYTFGTSIVNFLVFRLTWLRLVTIWTAVIRFLPVVVFFAAMSGSCATVFLDVRTQVPVGVLGSGSVVEWHQPGVVELELPSSFTITLGGSTNNLGVTLGAGELQRVIVRDDQSDASLLDVEVAGEYGFQWGFNRGFVMVGSLGVFWLVMAFAKGAFRMGFGGYSE